MRRTILERDVIRTIQSMHDRTENESHREAYAKCLKVCHRALEKAKAEWAAWPRRTPEDPPIYDYDFMAMDDL